MPPPFGLACLTHKEAQQRHGIEQDRGDPDLPYATWVIQDEQDGNSRGRVRLSIPLARTFVSCGPSPALVA